VRRREIPLALYVHFPWCLGKCSYCDFNSSILADGSLIPLYTEKLLRDLDQETSNYPQDQLTSIYFGGGTPSLIPPTFLNSVIQRAQNYFNCTADMEITLEANPETISSTICQQLREIGINRISLGAQSFCDRMLKIIGRNHNSQQTVEAISNIKAAGFHNFNLDLIFGLPQQTIDDAITDIAKAIQLAPTHLSWYQLSLDFHGNNRRRIFANVPNHEQLWKIQQAGIAHLKSVNFQQYEVSAYAQNPDYFCQHNLNYWHYGDYLGIGSGAHGKVTLDDYQVKRYIKITNPQRYLASNDYHEQISITAKEKIPFEFMLNTLRLHQPITYDLMQQRTGILTESIYNKLQYAEELGLVNLTTTAIVVTEWGRNFLNDLVEIFL
jgi:oxygen-independent coproporphyrinogen-3 oxidase